MNKNELTREQREQELMRMWSDRGKGGQAGVLQLCHRILPPGESIRAGMSVIDVILDHEFGPAEQSA
jgi:hypothetical protein